MHRALTLAVVTAVACSVKADVVNGDFEALPALTGWSVSGNAGTSTAAPAAPTSGARCALLTAGTTSGAALATQLGCTTAQLQAAAQTSASIANGAALFQTVTVSAGDALTFDFSFNNAEVANDQEWPDAAFVVINGVPELLATSGSLPHGWTQVRTHVKADLPVGEVRIAFAVCNLNDFAVPSQLMVDAVRIVSTTIRACGPADLGSQGGVAGFDNHLDNNDFIAFIDAFFARQPVADLGSQGGVAGADGQFDNNDFVAFIDAFFAFQGGDGC